MPIKKAAIKALRQSKKRTQRNKRIKDNISYLIKKAKKAIGAEKKDEASDWVKKAIKAIDGAVGKGVLKKNTGARKKSGLVKRLNQLSKS